MWQEASHRIGARKLSKKRAEITLRDLERLALDGVSSVRELFCNVRIHSRHACGPDEGESESGVLSFRGCAEGAGGFSG